MDNQPTIRPKQININQPRLFKKQDLRSLEEWFSKQLTIQTISPVVCIATRLTARMACFEMA